MNILVLDDKQYFNNFIDLYKLTRNFEVSFLEEYALFTNYAIKRLLLNVDLIIYITYKNIYYNYIVILANKLGIKTLSLVDGVLEWNNLYNNPKLNIYKYKQYNPILSSYSLVIGDEQLKYLSCLNPKTECYKFIPKRMKMQKNLLKENNIKYDILITTANTPYFNEEEKQLLVVLITNIVENLVDCYNVVFRIFDDELLANLPNNILNKKDGTFQEILNEVSIVITTPSSIVLEAMQNDKPTAQIIYRSSPLFFQSGWLITDMVNIEDTIKDMFLMDERRMEFQRIEVIKQLNVESDEISIIKNILDDNSKKNKEYMTESTYFYMLNSRYNMNVFFLLKKIHSYYKRLLNIR